jgi:hypothetical protein
MTAEIRMTNDELKTNDESGETRHAVFQRENSSFALCHSFGIRHWSFVIASL